MEVDSRIQYSAIPNQCNKDAGMYSVTSCQFPSHIRSIEPKHHIAVAMETDVTLTKESSKLSRKQIYILLITIFIISTSVAVGLTVYEIRRILQPMGHKMFESGHHTAVTNKTSLGHSNDTDRELGQIISGGDNRTPCINTCDEFDDAKFNSSCHHGYCVCRGDNYQEETCYPTVAGCTISKTLHTMTTSAYMDTEQVPVYVCTDNRQMTVNRMAVGIYGNHFSKDSVVNVTGISNRSLQIVLASHYPVRWRIIDNGNIIQAIYMICSQAMPTLDAVVLEESFKAKNRVPPNIYLSQSRTGYGNDRGESNTVAMIQMIDSRIGPITSFTGAKYANYITVDVNGL